jgi:hypothetical protein
VSDCSIIEDDEPESVVGQQVAEVDFAEAVQQPSVPNSLGGVLILGVVDVVLEVTGHPVAAHRRSALEVGNVGHVRVVQVSVVVAHDRLEDVPEVLHVTTIYYNPNPWIRGWQPALTHIQIQYT